MELVKTIVLLVLGFGVSAYLGYYFGFKKGLIVGATETVYSINALLSRGQMKMTEDLVSKEETPNTKGNC